MLARALVAVLAVLLLATTSVAGSISYLCRMHDGVHQQRCCCEHAEGQLGSEGPSVEPTNRCCEIQLSDSAQAPAVARSAVQGDLDLPVAVFTFAPLGVTPIESHVSTVPKSARAPPSGAGPPLFVLNCRYLI